MTMGAAEDPLAGEDTLDLARVVGAVAREDTLAVVGAEEDTLVLAGGALEGLRVTFIELVGHG